MNKVHVLYLLQSLLLTNIIKGDDVRPRITVWVHGTHVQKLLPSLFVSFNKKTVSFFENISPGLAHVDQGPIRTYTSTIARIFNEVSPSLFPFEHFYHFGWSGDPLVSVRREAGHQLYKELKDLIQKYRDMYGCEPILTLISHSHGGNVLLHMHECLQKDTVIPFVAEHLVLLGCPIQVATEPYVESPLFKSVVNIYSDDDRIQIIDPQCIHPLVDTTGKKSFSKRLREAAKRPYLSKRHIRKLPHTANIKVSWIAKAPWHECATYISREHIALFKGMSNIAEFFNTRRGLSHVELELPFFLKHIPELLQQMDRNKQHRCILNNCIEASIT